MTYTLIIIIAVFILLVLMMQPSRIIYIKLLSIPILCIIFVIFLILFSDTAVKSALNGLNLWAGVVVPSLLPFFIASGIMNATGFTNASGILLEPVMRPFFNVPGCSSFALALGVTSGYPVGAKITSDLRKSGALTKTEAERLLAFTNNSGPLFIIGAVGTGMYGSSLIGIFLFICHFLACITVGFLFRFYKPSHGLTAMVRYNVGKKTENSRKPSPGVKSKTRKRLLIDFRNRLIHESRSRAGFGTLLGEAIRDSVSTVLTIGGFIVLFSVIISLLKETGVIKLITEMLLRLLPQSLRQNGFDGVISGVLSGILEITTGSELVSCGTSIPLSIKLPAASFVIGWAGLSVHFQVMSIVSGTDINTCPYLLGKLLQGIAAAIYTWVGTKLVSIEMMITEPALGLVQFNMRSFFETLGRSVILLAAVITIWIGINLLIRSRAAAGKPSIKKSSI